MAHISRTASGFSRDMSNSVVPVAASSRHVLESVLTLAECRELVFIQRHVSVIGYRAHLRSSTIHDVAATEPALLIPLVRMPKGSGRQASRQALLQASSALIKLIELTYFALDPHSCTVHTTMHQSPGTARFWTRWAR